MIRKLSHLVGVVLLASLTLSCSHFSAQKPSKDFRQQVKVEPIEGRDAWRVTYSLSEPVKELIFDRQDNRFRTKLWRSLTPNVVIIDEKQQEKIVSKTPFQSVTFEIDSYYENTPKDYEFFVAFSDKSVAMYTGHIDACPADMSCDGRIDFVLTPRVGEHGIVAGEVFKSAYNWNDKIGRGTYVYFGRIQPLQSKRLTAVVDSKLPQWLRYKIIDLLPRLFYFYYKKTDQPLTFKPFIFLSYLPEGEGARQKGGTLPGLIQLNLSGKGWSKEDPEQFVELARFLAHESAHVWNGQLFSSSSVMWMHEGGADAFAYRALYGLKIISRQRLIDFQTEALGACLSLAKNRPLRKITEDPNYTAYYRCGSVYALITEKAVQKANPDLDLFSFWKELFEAAKSTDRTYTESDYFRTLDRMSGNNQASESLRYLLDRHKEGALADAIILEFRRLGIPFEVIKDNYPRGHNLYMARMLIRELMKEDCQGSYGLSSSPKGVSTDGMDKCSTFKKSMLLTHIDGYSIPQAGANAYEKVYERCKDVKRESKEKVELAAAGLNQLIAVKCPRGLSAAETFIRLLSKL